jgi:hypothetical protein
MLRVIIWLVCFGGKPVMAKDFNEKDPSYMRLNAEVFITIC